MASEQTEIARPLSPVIQLQLLGPLELSVSRENRTHLLTYDKPRLLLALLALGQGEPLLRARAVDLLWPNIPETQGKARMRHALHVLRQALADVPQALIIDTERLALRAGTVQVDVLSLMAEGAGALDDEMCLALYRGPLLDELQPRLEGGLGEWLARWERRLNDRLRGCRERLVADWLARNQLRDALRHARRWIEIWPLDESCHRILIDVLARSGRYDDAHRAYAQCRSALAAGLGAQPDDATEELMASLPVSYALRDAAQGADDIPLVQPLAVIAVALNWRMHDDQAEGDFDAAALAGLERACLAVRRCIRQHGAWLQPSAGNQFVAYLGYPLVCETPVHRAAVLAQALHRLPLPAQLTMSVGLHAGVAPCTPGLRPDHGSRMAQLALALNAQARPGEVLLSPAASARLTGYEISELRRHEQTVRLLGRRSAEAPARLHGRADEFGQLAAAWRRCVDQRKSMALAVRGAAGHGKTLLAACLAQQARQGGGDVIWLRCWQDLRDQPLHPLRLWLLNRLPPAALASDQELASSIGLPLGECRGLLALLQLAADPGPAVSGAQALPAACRVVERCAHTSEGLLIVVDDVQWADEETRVWLDMLASHDFGSPTLVLSLRRETAGMPRDQDTVELPALDSEAAASLLVHRARGSQPDKAMLSAVARLGAGNPSHLTLLLQQALAGQELALPATLRDRVCALLIDLDGEARRLAYLCALFDAPLSAGQAAMLLEWPEAALQECAQRLRDAGVLRLTASDLLQCAPLIGTAIVALIPAAVSAPLSLRIGQHLIELEQPHARVAPFLQKAGDARAPAWWKAAAADALQVGALREAAELVEQALRSSVDIGDETERDRLVFECQMLRGSIIAATSGPAHPDAASSFELATALRPAADLNTMVQTLWAHWMTAQNAGSHVEALRLAQQLMHTAESFQDARAQAWASYAVAQHYLWRGLGREAESLLLHSETLLESEPAAAPPQEGQNHALIPASLALAYGLQGKYDQAYETLARALAQAMQAQAWAVVLLCRLAEARIHYLQGDWCKAGELADEVVTHTRAAAELTAWHAVATGYAMLARVLALHDPAALAAMEQALPVIRVGLPVAVDGHLCLLARARIAMGDPQGAEALLDEAQTLGGTHGSSSLRSEIHCLRGDARAASGDDLRARAHWRHARTEASAMGQLPYAAWADARLRASELAVRPPAHAHQPQDV